MVELGSRHALVVISAIVFSFSLLFSQEENVEETITLTSEQMIKLTEKIEKLQHDISIYKQIGIQDSITIAKQDSLVFVLNQKYDLCDARLKEVEPKWYENKWLYLLIGAFSVKSIDEALQKID